MGIISSVSVKYSLSVVLLLHQFDIVNTKRSGNISFGLAFDISQVKVLLPHLNTLAIISHINQNTIPLSSPHSQHIPTCITTALIRNNNCTYNFRSNSTNGEIPKLFYCTSLFLYFITATEYDEIFVKNKVCLPTPICHPHNNWHFVLITQPNNMTLVENELAPTAISKPVTLVVRNAIFMKLNNIFYLVREKWVEYKESKLIKLKSVVKVALKQKQNYNLEFIEAVSPFPTGPPEFTKEYSRSILRNIKLKKPDPAIVIVYTVIEQVNGTIFFPTGPPVGSDGLSIALPKYTNAISIPLGVNSVRWKYLEFSAIISINYLLFLTPLPMPTGQNFLFLVKPFRKHAWLALGTVFVVTLGGGVILIHSLEKFRAIRKGLSSSTNNNISKLFKSLKNVGKTLLLPLIDQSSQEMRVVTLNNIPMQIIVGIWMLGSIVLCTLYRSTLVSFLIQPSLTNPPRTVVELFNSNYEISRTPWFTTQALQGLNNDVKKQTGLNASSRIKISSSPADCFLGIVKGDNACIAFDMMIDILVRKFLTDRFGQDLFLKSKDQLLPTISGLPISPFSAIKPIADRILSNLRSGGIIDKWTSINSEFNRIAGRRNARLQNSTQNENSHLKLVSSDGILYAIYLLIGGSIAGLICFMYEFLQRTNQQDNIVNRFD